MNFSVIADNLVVLVWVACLVLGYCIKHATIFKKIPNNDIPVILAIFGCVLNGFINGFTTSSLIYGAATGLASTGAHQAFIKFIDDGTEDEVA